MKSLEEISEKAKNPNRWLSVEKIESLELEPRGGCPLCGTSDKKNQFVLDCFEVEQCASCDFLYVSSVLGSIAMQNLYKHGYDNERHIQGQRVNASVNIDVLSNLIPDLQGKSLLDIGSGYGFFLLAASHRYSMRVAGVELSIAESKYARENLGVKSYEDILLLPKNERFDIVTAFEVIEHVRDPVSFIEALMERVDDGGYLIIATDNFESEVVRRLGAGFPKWIPHEHISYFAPKSLSFLLSQFPNFAFVGSCSFTPWELQLRSVLARFTSGRLGRASYRFMGFASDLPGKGYRLFRIRLALNSVWSKLTMKTNLEGEMMFICVMKTKEK